MAAHYRSAASFEPRPVLRANWICAWKAEMAKVRSERQFQTRTGSVAYILP
jgi:hypothetical protein